MNAWTIYWILQLDSIKGFLVAGCAVSAGLLFFTMLGGVIFTECGTDKYLEGATEKWVACKKIGRWLGIAVAIFGLGRTLVPSTKTAAAMVVLPAITNNETIRHEAGDLYQLAKQALANAVAPDKPERKK